MFGKAIMNCIIGLVIQAIEILGLKLLEVLWDGVCNNNRQLVSNLVSKPPSTPKSCPIACYAGFL
jgi:hypothetical protein